MLREFSGAAACGATLAATLSLATPALALTPSTYTPSTTAQVTGLSLIARADPVPGAPDPNAPRAWSFWSSDGTAWLTGDQNSPVPDGSILGWRFAASADGSAQPPNGDMPEFARICGKQPAAAGHKRVAIVVDFGDTETDAYPGDRPPSAISTCVSGTESASGTQLLASTAKTRTDAQGAPLAIGDYPSREKGGTPITAATPPPAEGGLPVLWIAGGAGVLLLLGGGAVVATRRRAKVGR